MTFGARFLARAHSTTGPAPMSPTGSLGGAAEILHAAPAACLAGLQAGIYPAPAEFAKGWKLDRRFAPKMREDERATRYAGWLDAVERTLTARTQRPASGDL